ncbi:MAG: translation initiation factor IF-2 [Verrucomicrobiales bacterium]
MPVRIYEIAKQLGIPNKEVIARAKELGISNAKVPSSSIDKITAEYLIKEMGGGDTQETPAQEAAQEAIVVVKDESETISDASSSSEDVPTEPTESEASEEGSIKVIHAEEPVEAETPEDVPEETSSTEAVGASQEASSQSADTPDSQEETTQEVAQNTADATPAKEPEANASDEPSASPTLGAKIGFIQLPTKPAGASSRPGDRRKERDQKRKLKQREQDGPVTESAQPAAAPTEPKPKPKFIQKYKIPEDGEQITLKPPIIIRDLAQLIQRKPFQLIADLMELNVFATVNQAIEEPVAKQVCAKHGFRFEVEKREKGAGFTKTEEAIKLDHRDKDEDLDTRPPVVTIMGHVDHGKTTLLDVIRKSNVVDREAGGITQHIGAYTIHFPHPERPEDIQQITFLDTPGHAAFSAMRARGANVTDIVILVVAADDGVMPQTVEALNHAKASGAPIIVAVNKCDHPSANPMKPRQQLQDRGLMCEEWGGETIYVDVSAITKQGVDTLLEMVLLQAEVLELKANPNRKATGNVIESGMAQGGPTATILVRKGTLKVGDTMICGPYYGRVKALINAEGERLKQAEPSVAVKVLGLNGVPEAGVEFNIVKNEKQARKLAEEREEDAKQQSAERRKAVTLENLFNTLKEGAAKSLKVVIKADTQGSTEAIVDSLSKIESDKVDLEVIHSGVGSITDSDVMLAAASQAIVIGFHSKLDTGVTDTAKREGVQIRLYSIIYELIDEVRDSMVGLLDPVTKEKTTGKAEIRKVFNLSKGGAVAGSYVTDGKVVRSRARLYRKEKLVYEGIIASLRRFQDEVQEIGNGMECGIRIEGFSDYQEGDVIETFQLEKVTQEL